MSLNCPCPPGAKISDIDIDDCIERIGQIGKIGLQRTYTGLVLNEITIALTNPNVLATWTDLKAATDSTRVQFTPKINEPDVTPGEARSYGGGNQTLGGIPINLGTNPTAFVGAFLDVKQAIIKQIKTFRCEKAEGLSLFLINAGGIVWGLTDDPATPAIFRGIPAEAFFVSDKKPGGYDEPDKNFISWQWLEDWSDYLYAVTPTDFNALSTQL